MAAPPTYRGAHPILVTLPLLTQPSGNDIEYIPPLLKNFVFWQCWVNSHRVLFRTE